MRPIDLAGPGAGELRHRVTLQRRPDGFPEAGPAGDPADDWETVRTCWAAIEPLSGRELANAARVHATTSHRITLRAVAPVDPSWRVTFRSRAFGIDSVLDVGEAGAFLILMATEREGDTA